MLLQQFNIVLMSEAIIILQGDNSLKNKKNLIIIVLSILCTLMAYTILKQKEQVYYNSNMRCYVAYFQAVDEETGAPVLTSVQSESSFIMSERIKPIKTSGTGRYRLEFGKEGKRRLIWLANRNMPAIFSIHADGYEKLALPNNVIEEINSLTAINSECRPVTIEMKKKK